MESSSWVSRPFYFHFLWFKSSFGPYGFLWLAFLSRVENANLLFSWVFFSSFHCVRNIRSSARTAGAGFGFCCVNASNSKDLIFSSIRAKLEFVVDIMIFSLFDFRLLILSRTYTSESVSTSVVLLAFSNSNF